MKYRTIPNIEDFQIKKEKYQAEVCFQKWETKKYKKRNKDKGIKPLPLHFCIIVT